MADDGATVRLVDEPAVAADEAVRYQPGAALERGPNADTRTLNAARFHEVDMRKWRNNMRRTMIFLKGGYPSRSPWCGWVNDPLENEDIGVDWTPPPAPPPTTEGDEPPF